MDARYNIGEISQLSGCSRRNIYYYVQRGLLPRPNGSGNTSYYDETHLEVLLKVKELQDQGVIAVAELQELIRPLIAGRADDKPVIIAESSPQIINEIENSTLFKHLKLPEGVELSWSASSDKAEALVIEIMAYIKKREADSK